MAEVAPSLTLAERRRLHTTREIEEAAAALFEERGYEETTVEEIAQAAGISLRTFYRYFATKADAVTSMLPGGGQLLADAVRSREHLPLMDALVEGFVATAGFTGPDRAHRARLVALNVRTPALLGAWLAAGRAAQDALLPVISARAPQADAATNRALSATVVAAFTVALESWSASPDLDLAAITRRCLGVLESRLRPGSE